MPAELLHFLDKINPYAALFCLGCIGQWVAYRSDLAKRDTVVSNLTSAVNRLAAQLGGSK